MVFFTEFGQRNRSLIFNHLFLLNDGKVVKNYSKFFFPNTSKISWPTVDLLEEL